jgi:hypothetical protein
MNVKPVQGDHGRFKIWLAIAYSHVWYTLTRCFRSSIMHSAGKLIPVGTPLRRAANVDFKKVKYMLFGVCTSHILFYLLFCENSHST